MDSRPEGAWLALMAGETPSRWFGGIGSTFIAAGTNNVGRCNDVRAYDVRIRWAIGLACQMGGRNLPRCPEVTRNRVPSYELRPGRRVSSSLYISGGGVKKPNAW